MDNNPNEKIEQLIREIDGKISTLSGLVLKLESIITHQDINNTGKKKSNENMIPAREQTIGEFLKDKGPDSGPDKALMCAYYHEIIRGNKHFNVHELTELLVDAREGKVANSNVGALINKNQGKTYFAEYKQTDNDQDNQHKGKRWRITQSGIEIVENFNKNKNANK